MENNITEASPSEDNKSNALAELVLLIPRILRLCAGLMRDHDVSGKNKAVIVSSAIYIAFPKRILFGDSIPSLYGIDRIYAALAAICSVITTTDFKLLMRHWNGSKSSLEELKTLMCSLELQSRGAVESMFDGDTQSGGSDE